MQVISIGNQNDRTNFKGDIQIAKNVLSTKTNAFVDEVILRKLAGLTIQDVLQPIGRYLPGEISELKLTEGTVVSLDEHTGALKIVNEKEMGLFGQLYSWSSNAFESMRLALSDEHSTALSNIRKLFGVEG